MFKKNPRTVSQITSSLQNIVDELESSKQQYQDKVTENEGKISLLSAENRDISAEMNRNSSVAGKLKDLLG